MSGPARRDDPLHASHDPLAQKVAATQKLAEAMPHNVLKASEYGEAAQRPLPGAGKKPRDPRTTGSTVTESQTSTKVGDGTPPIGRNAAHGPLDRVRVDSGGQTLTTNQGVPVADNQHSLKAGLRGPALLEDFILREKITHFDHERIPERVVHARGSGAHGYFECYAPLTKYTHAALFAEAGKRTPVFVRFSTVAGERGSADTVRDVRGFAVKFYTDEGNFDLVGNNIPVFFIQDAMKFPDLVHALKPEPHFAMPQASSAHDTFWDFVSLMPESAHMLLWVMSDRAIPRSYRMMQGFGVHTYRLVNARGESHFVKFHWSPLAGTHSLDWDEAVKIAGADPDFHRRDLWEAIEAGAFPAYELGLQIFTEEEAAGFSFDVLDATKIIPEELVSVTPVGRMVLNRNPDNFFAETEQVAFCVAHIVPGIDFSDDPLLAGRIHSYLDTQLTRLGGPNFHEIAINAPTAEVHNNHRDGLHRQAIHRGRVAYEPNSLGGGCPFQAGMQSGFTSYAEPLGNQLEPVSDVKVRGKGQRFAEHYAQATLFWESQTPVEQAHIVRAFRFELSRVQTPAVRERVVALLANVAEALAKPVAEGLGIALPEPLPKASDNGRPPEVIHSPVLSLQARPGDGQIETRRVALLVTDGVDGAQTRQLYLALDTARAVPRLVGPRLGTVRTTDGRALEVDVSLEASPAPLYDALVVLGGNGVSAALAQIGPAVEFIKDTYRHCKPILAVDATALMEDAARTTLPSGEPDPGVLLVDEVDEEVIQRFVAAIGQHRAFARYADPPRV
jgi:catalase